MNFTSRLLYSRRDTTKEENPAAQDKDSSEAEQTEVEGPCPSAPSIAVTMEGQPRSAT
jgi:hypothetical protein